MKGGEAGAFFAPHPPFFVLIFHAYSWLPHRLLLGYSGPSTPLNWGGSQFFFLGGSHLPLPPRLPPPPLGVPVALLHLYSKVTPGLLIGYSAPHLLNLVGVSGPFCWGGSLSQVFLEGGGGHFVSTALLHLYSRVTRTLLCPYSWCAQPLLSPYSSFTLLLLSPSSAFTLGFLTPYSNFTHPLLWAYSAVTLVVLSLYFPVTLDILSPYSTLTLPLLQVYSPLTPLSVVVSYLEITQPLLWVPWYSIVTQPLL